MSVQNIDPEFKVYRPVDEAILTAQAVAGLYGRAQWRGKLYRLFARLTRQGYRLRDLAAAEAEATITRRYYAGTQTVPLAAIRGSESRGADFDAWFHPLRPHDRNRWLSVATAWHQGLDLSPVELIQMGTHYFVRDGHHRISIAAALGVRDIEANVTVWQMAVPAPQPVCSPVACAEPSAA
ncbi:MAG TPA: hypothetical protein VF276_03510 [Chloroflexia bacterium]